MKKIIRALLCLSLSQCALSYSYAFSNNLTGFFVGPQLGYSMGKDKLKYRRAGVHNINSDHSITGAVGGLFAGYQKDTESVVFGGEIFVDLGSVKGKLNDREHLLKIDFKRSWGYGAAAKIGGKINKLVLYGKFLLEYTNFQAKVQD